MIANWNSVVSPDDIVYHLGDVMLNDNTHGMDCLRQLNGYIKLIRGNHDTDARIELYKSLPNIEVLGWAEVIKYKKYQFYLSHHPTLTSNLENAPYLRMHLINLCGHRHTNNRFEDMINGNVIYHVEVDAHNNFPVKIDQIIDELKIFLANNDQKDCTLKKE